MSTCDPCATVLPTNDDGTCAMPSCKQMMCEAVTAYNAVRRGLMTGRAAVEVQFGEQRVKYQATSDSAKFLLDEIRRLHQTCGTPESAAILGIGGAGALSVRFGC